MVKCSRHYLLICLIIYFVSGLLIYKIYNNATNKITITNYSEPIVEGWPPNKSRDMKLYIRPNISSFLLTPRLDLSNTVMVVVVLSGDAMFSRRMTIRDTWKKHTLIYPGVKVIFHIGKTQQMKLQENIEQENIIFDDILQSDIEDAYNTVTIKEVLSHKYLLSLAWKIRPAFIMKADDDTYVNIPELWRIFINNPIFPRTKLLVGFRHDGAIPIRILPKDRHLKFTKRLVVPEYIFSGNRFPSYLGASYVMSYDAFDCIYKQALLMPFFHINDIFITGFCADLCGFNRLHYKKGFSYNHKDFKELTRNYIAIHYMNEEDQKDAWTNFYCHAH